MTTEAEVLPQGMTRCERCGDVGDDRRTVAIDCMYDLTEAGLAELPRTKGAPRRYGARVCKDCRGDFIALTRGWLRSPPEPADESVERLVPVRVDGATRMMTMDEYTTWRRENPMRDATSRQP